MRVRRIVARNLGVRLAAVLCVAMGILSVQIWQSSSEPVVGVLQVRLQPEPETVIGNRDLDNYEFGGQGAECSSAFWSESDCDKLKNKEREFILKHWKKRKRAYIVLKRSGMHYSKTIHVFIEPDKNGEWCVVSREKYLSHLSGFTNTIDENRGYFIKIRSAKEEGYCCESRGTNLLFFLDKDGNEVFRL